MSKAFPAPYRSPAQTVDPAWIDYNGHLNMAYYSVLFDRSVDSFLDALGLGPVGLKERGSTVFTLEAHIGYLREIHAQDQVVVDNQLIDFDHKRIHFFQTMTQIHGGFVAATFEQLALSVDLATRRSAPFRPESYERIKSMAKAHAALPRPERFGKTIAIRKSP